MFLLRMCRHRLCRPKSFLICLLLYAGLLVLRSNQLKTYLRITMRTKEEPSPDRLKFSETIKRFDSLRPEWLKSAKPMEHLDETVRRCAAENMGCFSILSKAKAEKKIGNITLESCLEVCFRRKLSFAGVRQEKCYCGKSLDDFVVNKYCDASCSIDASKNCTSFYSIRVYRKTGGCFSGGTTPPESSFMVGCSSPPDITTNITIWTMPSMTTQQCILKCESIERILAMPLLDYKACICSDLLSMFSTAENMQAVMLSCDEKPLENTNRQRFPIYKTFVEECGPKRFLKRKEGPHTILTSFWGSGNTWLRHLIEVATGIYTGSIYKDESLYRGGMIGEKSHFRSGRTIIIKDHIMTKPEKVSKFHTSAVLLIRNLYDAILAEFARLHSHHNHTALVDPKLYERPGFGSSVKELAPKWIYHAAMLFDLIPHVKVVYYEDLRQDSVRELRRILSFLPQSLLPHGNELERRLMCMKLDSTGNFKRGSKGIRKNPFNAKVQEVVNTEIKRMSELLFKRDKPGLPASYYKPWEL